MTDWNSLLTLPIYSMGLGFDSTLVLGPQASPGLSFPLLKKGLIILV